MQALCMRHSSFEPSTAWGKPATVGCAQLSRCSWRGLVAGQLGLQRLDAPTQAMHAEASFCCFALECCPAINAMSFMHSIYRLDALCCCAAIDLRRTRSKSR